MSDYSINATIGADSSGFEKAIKRSSAELEDFADYFAKVGDDAKASFTGIANQFTAIDSKAKVWGNSTDVIADKQRLLKNEINRLIDQGLKPEDVKIQALKKSYDTLGKSQDNAKSSTKSMWQTFASMRDVMQGPVAAIQMLGNALKGIGSATVGQSAKIEDMVAAFTPLTGGAENAKNMVNALNKEAATTPFELEGIASVAKQLLPVLGNDVNAVTSTFRMLGDTAGGNIEKLDTITRGYMKTMMKGKVDMESLNMIADAGVPIHTQLAKSMGITVNEMMAMSSAGKITDKDLTNAFKNMTGAGGIFFDGMNVASQTLTGKLSSMSDALNMSGAAIGQAFLPIVKSIVDAISIAAGGFVKWASEGNNLAAAFKAIATVGVSAIIAAIVASIPALLAGLTAIKASLLAINTTALFGPTGIIIGLGLLVAAFVALADSNHQNVLKGIEDEFGSLAKEAGMTAEKIYKIEEAISNASKGGGGFEEAADFIKQASKDLGITEDQVVAIALKSRKVTDEYKAQIVKAQELNKTRDKGEKEYSDLQKASLSLVIGTKEWIDAQTKAREAYNKKQRETMSSNIKAKELEDEMEKGRIKAEKEYNDVIKKIAENIKAKYITIEDGTKQNESAARKYADSLIDLGYTFDDTKSKGGIALNELNKKLQEGATKTDSVSVAFKGVYDAGSVSFGLLGGAIKKASDQITFMEYPISDLGMAWQDFIFEAQEKAASWKDTFKEIGSLLKGGITDSFELLGKVLVTGAGFEEFGNIALNVLASVLEALGQQLIVMAAANFANPIAAMGLLAGAATAFVSAGAAKAMINTGKAAKDAASEVNNLATALDTSASSAGDVIKKMVAIPDVVKRQLDAEQKLAIWRKAKIIDEELLAKAEEKRLAAIASGKTYLAAYNGYAVETYYTRKNYAEALKQIPALEKDIADAVAYKTTVIANANYELGASIENTNIEISANKWLFTDAAQSGIAFKTVLSSIQGEALSFVQSIQNVGTEISGNLISAMEDGFNKTSFLDSMKKYILNMVIQAAVYTDEIKTKMAEIGTRIAEGIAKGFSEASLSGIKDELSALFDNASKAAEVATGIVNSVFPSAPTEGEATGYASGTAYATAGWHVVGEQGPERVYLPQGSRVTNAVNTARGGSGGSVSNITLAPVFNSPKAMNQYEQMRSLRQYNKDMAFQGVI